MQRLYAPLLKALGLTYVQYLVLLVLWESDDRTVSEIGRRLFLDSGTLTPVLRRLERRGAVTRRRAVDDEREVRIRLTAAGALLETELTGVRAQVACRAALTPAAFARLRDDLRAFHGRIVAPSS
jgi:DNA-binding MarR family transcriptional regulator